MLASKIAMIRPLNFRANMETAVTNGFQDVRAEVDPGIALIEFDRLVEALQSHDVDVSVFESTEIDAPDAIFPNNWFATLPDGDLFTFPMLAHNRRLEREPQILEELIDRGDYNHIDLEYLENENPPLILEGTGSLVLDHELRIGFAALSPRTDLDAIAQFEMESGYQIYTFNAGDKNGAPIYHTNVMLTLGNGFAIVGYETVLPSERKDLLQTLIDSGREVIQLTNDQVYNHFAGNMIQISNTRNERLLVMSQRASDSLTTDQRGRLRQYNDEIIVCDVSSIETLGGGSVRCMIAELF